MGMLLRRYKQQEDPAVKEKIEVKVEKTETEVKTEVKKGRTKKK